MSKAESDLAAHIRWMSAAVSVAYTGTAGRTALLPPGLYYVTSDQDCYILQGDATVVADTSDPPLWAKTYVPVKVRITGDGDGYISAVRVSTSGTVYAIPADA